MSRSNPTKTAIGSSNVRPDSLTEFLAQLSRNVAYQGDQMFRPYSRLLIAALLLVLLLPSAALTQEGPVEFSLRSIDGQTITAQSLRGEVVVLAFGASWLPLSKTQLQGVRKLADEYSNRGVVVYWVSTESEDSKSKNYAGDDQLRNFAKKHGLNVTVLRDPDGEVSKKLGVDQLPAIVIIDKTGTPVGPPIAGLDPNGNLASQLASKLDKIL
jgi:peroxiredoxin